MLQRFHLCGQRRHLVGQPLEFGLLRRQQLRVGLQSAAATAGGAAVCPVPESNDGSVNGPPS
jgi:hypothetical protein